jgi:hypothetical protein
MASRKSSRSKSPSSSASGDSGVFKTWWFWVVVMLILTGATVGTLIALDVITV